VEKKGDRVHRDLIVGLLGNCRVSDRGGTKKSGNAQGNADTPHYIDGEITDPLRYLNASRRHAMPRV